MQPPPRGCVLKHGTQDPITSTTTAAASARLCVETSEQATPNSFNLAAASARLCVETIEAHF